MQWKQSTALILTAGALCGCAGFDDQLSGRYGPSPVLIAATVQASAARETAVVAAVSGRVDPVTGEVRLPAYGQRGDWYPIILMGFNTIDDACMAYLDDLWILERRKTRNSTIIHVTGAAVAAIIGANANPSAATLTILAQAFGLAGALNNAIADSYLYSQSAATVKKLVFTTTAAYRNDLAKNFIPDRTDKGLPVEVVYPMASVPAAYHHMREYLALCLPPSIQGQVEDLVAKAKAAPAGSTEEKKVADQKAAGAAPAAATTTRRTTPRTSPQLSVF